METLLDKFPNYLFSPDKDVNKELVKVQELIKANIQRSKVIQDQVWHFYFIEENILNQILFLGVRSKGQLADYFWAQAQDPGYNFKIPEQERPHCEG